MQSEETTVEKEEKPNENLIVQGIREKSSLRLKCFLTAAPIAACEKADQIFGTGGEVIVHYLWFAQGRRLFECLLEKFPERTHQELLKMLTVECQQVGLGTTQISLVNDDLPAMEVVVKNPAVKTVKGSQKLLIGSFWAGILSECYGKHLTPKSFNYNHEADEFSCLITA